MFSDSINPREIANKAWEFLVVQPWERVKCVHDSAPDPGAVRIGYQILMAVVALAGFSISLPVLALIALYAALYHAVEGVLLVLEKIGVIGSS